MTLISFILGLGIGVGATIWLILWAALIYSREKTTDITEELLKDLSKKNQKTPI